MSGQRSTEGDQAFVTRLPEVESVSVEAGVNTQMQVLIGADRAPNFAMRCFTMQPGGSMPAHTNSVEHEQYVLGGSAQVGIGDQVFELKTGDVLYIPAGVPHWYRTTSEEQPYRFLCVVPNSPDQVELVNS